MWSGPLGVRGGGGEEWEGLHCWETERERENHQLSTAVEIFTIVIIPSHPYGLAYPSVSA